MSYLVEPGHVYEVMRSHFVIALNADLVALHVGELLILVRGAAFQGQALRVDTSEIVHITLLEIAGLEDQTYHRVWP